MADAATIECFEWANKGIARCGNVGCAAIAVVGVAESAQRAEELLTPHYREQLMKINSPTRRAQSQAWRVAAREMLGGGIRFTYNAVGAPEIEDSLLRISVSHTSTLAVVAASSGPCGVDIERLDRNFQHVASRYISPSEEALPASSHPHFRAAIWCAKEAVYKYLGRREIDFVNDITIERVDTLRGVIEASFRGTPLPPIHLRIIEGHMLCLISSDSF